MSRLLTQDPSSGSFVDSGADKENNLQVLCEAFAGTSPGTQGTATWGNAATLTVTDSRVTATSIIVFGAVFGSQAAVGGWRVSSRSAGSFVVTSTETETSGTTFWYFVINK